MTFKIYEPIDMQKAIAFTKSLPSAVALGIRKGFQESGRLLQKDVRDEMTNGKKTGRVYLVGLGIGGRILKNKRLHQASAPGEYPAVITGKLRRSIGFNVFGAKRLEFGSNSPYARALELGTQNIAPRLYLKQTTKKFDKHIEVILTRRINIEIRKQGGTIK